MSPARIIEAICVASGSPPPVVGVVVEALSAVLGEHAARLDALIVARSPRRVSRMSFSLSLPTF
jgi:hypothetical protein